jgi:hypothetical protein
MKREQPDERTVRAVVEYLDSIANDQQDAEFSDCMGTAADNVAERFNLKETND